MLVSPYKINHALSNNGLLKKNNPYKLLKKTGKLFIKDYQPQLLAYTPNNADTFSYVAIGKQNDNNFSQKIISFFSPDGNTLRKVFLSTEKPTIIRDYETLSQKENSIERILKKIKTKIFDNKNFKYKMKSAEEQKILKDFAGHKIKLQINKNTAEDKFLLTEVTEYPWIFSNGKKEGNKKKLQLGLNTSNGLPEIKSVKVQNLTFPGNDKYLPYRMIIDRNLKLLYLTKFLLKEKGLSGLNTSVKISKELDDKTAAYFSELDNQITFNKFAKNNPVKLSAHEVQHAYQFAQIGRLGKGRSKYCHNSKAIKGEITETGEREEALRYYISSEKYPQIGNGVNLSANKDYTQNYLEKDANREAEKIYKDYQEKGKELGQQLILGNI